MDFMLPLNRLIVFGDADATTWRDRSLTADTVATYRNELEWCVRRSRMAPVRRSDPKTSVHSSNGRLDVMMLEPRRAPLNPAQHQVFDCVVADRTAIVRLPDGALDRLHFEALEKPKHLNVFAFAPLIHARLEQPAQRGERPGQRPALQRPVRRARRPSAPGAPGSA